MSLELSEQELVRRESLAKLKAEGIEPFPAALFPVDTLSKEVKENYEEGKKVVVAGRLMSKNIMGK
ncbi:MAG: lysine--tRNA ligase, partial [Flavobacteriales bacterium]